MINSFGKNLDIFDAFTGTDLNVDINWLNTLIGNVNSSQKNSHVIGQTCFGKSTVRQWILVIRIGCTSPSVKINTYIVAYRYGYGIVQWIIETRIGSSHYELSVTRRTSSSTSLVTESRFTWPLANVLILMLVKYVLILMLVKYMLTWYVWCCLSRSKSSLCVYV